MAGVPLAISIDGAVAEIYKRLLSCYGFWFVLSLAIPNGAASVARAEASESRNSPPIISHIPRQRVESTAIAAIGYSKRRHILEIEFVNGAIYRYLDVPPAVYRDLMSAESKARFYDSNIRRHYRSILVRPQSSKNQGVN
jgi:KTSC domain-containing protein